MCLATAPQVLLLDEPLAGMGAEETDRMLALLQTLKADHAILLVEHDVPLVMRVCERMSVLDFGQIIAEGTPAEVRANEAVLSAYLGTGPAGLSSAPNPAGAQ
jgi:ABC-type branched-subunit amino acid transport system ATPase component